ncbi:MAG: hypothetical protein U5L07_10720 [Desulfobacterales bacterium]|nr:hypothetical protein [Desulfobacterales bacterium]
MKYLSFKILLFCILMPPVLYLLSSHFLQGYLSQWYERDIKNVYLSEINDVLNGITPISDAVQESIDQYKKESVFPDLGGRLEVTVRTNQGNILYPPAYQSATIDNLPTDPVKLAGQNFEILNNGLNLEVTASIPPYSLISVSLLLFYILIFLATLYTYYRRALKSDRREEAERAEELKRLADLEHSHKERAQSLADEREALLSEYQEIQKSLESTKQKAEKEEEEFFEEIENLEERLQENLARQNEQVEEINQLKEKIEELEKDRQAQNHQKEKVADKLGRRIKVLYKNIDITDRALDGLSDLDEDIGLKAEELIHQLNDDPSLVNIKRKVFSKKGKATVFEVIFAYRGRLYFRKTSQNRVEVLAIGTKKTQNKDLAYLDSL